VTGLARCISYKALTHSWGLPGATNPEIRLNKPLRRPKNSLTPQGGAALSSQTPSSDTFTSTPKDPNYLVH
ncbi:MAG: hypothetical protein ACK5HO_03800, partial [Pseudomonadota bacterium]